MLRMLNCGIKSENIPIVRASITLKKIEVHSIYSEMHIHVHVNLYLLFSAIQIPCSSPVLVLFFSVFASSFFESIFIEATVF